MKHPISELLIDVTHNIDCIEGMQNLSDCSIDMILTSPPYDGLRNYGVKSEELDLTRVSEECYRVLKNGSVMVWIVGDQTIDGCETLSSFKQALAFKEIGFRVETMIYEKTGNTAPPQDVPRYNQQFEYMFVCSKGKATTFNPQMQPTKPRSNTRWNNSNRQEDGTLWKVVSKHHPFKKRGNVWRYNTGGICTTSDRYAFDHPAMFPERLAQDHILSWSEPGDTVLDPFMGSGTTAKMCILNERHFLGFEIDPGYTRIAERRAKEAFSRVRGRTKLTDYIESAISEGIVR